MTWEYEYDPDADETTIYWDETEQGSIEGKITRWSDGYPLGKAREVVAEAIQSADPPERIRMQFDLNYGFGQR